MSDPGEREDAPEIEDIEDVQDETSGQDDERDGAGSDEDGADEGEGDEGSDGDDAGGKDPSGDHEGKAGQPAQVKPRSAATIAVQEAKRAAKAERERADLLQRQMDEIQRGQQQRSHAEWQAEERARLELMSPDEKVDYYRNKDRQEFEGRFNQLQFQMADSADRTAFENICARDPALAALRDATEAKLYEMRRQGSSAPRETIATFLLGQKARERAAKGGSARQAARGKDRVERQKVNTPSGRSDVRGGETRRGGDTAAARRSRLEDQQI